MIFSNMMWYFLLQKQLLLRCLMVINSHILVICYVFLYKNKIHFLCPYSLPTPMPCWTFSPSSHIYYTTHLSSVILTNLCHCVKYLIRPRVISTTSRSRYRYYCHHRFSSAWFYLTKINCFALISFESTSRF